MNVAAELIQKLVSENARIAQDQNEYAKRYNALAERFEAAKAKLEKAQTEIAKKQAQKQMMENFCAELKKLPKLVETFDEATWFALCDYITVYSKEDIRVTFRNGMEIRV